MKAAVVTDQGVQYTDAPKPSPKANEILIKVKAASLNRADLAVASGNRHGTVGGPGTIVGLECAGEVEAVGSEVAGIKPGDRVMGSAPAAHAEYAATDSGRVHRIPANNMTFAQAACFPVALQTMHNAIEVDPLDASATTVEGDTSPDAIAYATMFVAIRSLVHPLGSR